MKKGERVKWSDDYSIGTGTYIESDGSDIRPHLIIRDDRLGWAWRGSDSKVHAPISLPIGTKHCFWARDIEPIKEPITTASEMMRMEGAMRASYRYDPYLGYGPSLYDPKTNQSSGEQNKPRTIKMKINAIMKRLLDPDAKKLVKADIVDGRLFLTDDGREILEAILFEEHKEKLVAAAEEIIKNQK